MILGVDGMLSLRLAADCSGAYKTMPFICDLLCKVIDELGPETNLVMRESLDDALHHLLPWDIELLIDEPVVEPEEEPEL